MKELKYYEYIEKIIEEKKIVSVFPKRAANEAGAVPQAVSNKDMRGRLDLRDKLLVTIDGEDAKDLDDAVSLEMTRDGNYRLGVHIADVSHYVKAKSPLDDEAFRRATSVYFPGMVIPMLPKELSNGICSLNEGVDRLCMTVFIDIDRGGDIVRYELAEAVMNSRARMTYTSVAAILSGDETETAKYKEIAPMLIEMKSLMEILNLRRVKRGSIDFDLPECKIELDAAGGVTGLSEAPRTAAHKLIEEFMLIANEVTAQHMFNLKAPYVYRVHEKPSLEKIQNLYSLSNALGFRVNAASRSVTPKALQRLLKDVAESQYSGLMNKVMLRSMMKAKYSPENLGHFGLAAKYYCHFTSPIRRYPDLVAHRMIKLWLHDNLFSQNMRSLKAFVGNAAEQSSEREVAAEQAERDGDDLYKAIYMQQFLGEEFDGVISGVSSFGIFVELANTAEGLIWLESLPGDRYKFVEDRYLLYNPKNSYRMGDKIRIKVVKCDIDARKIEFALAQEQPVNPTAEKPVRKGFTFREDKEQSAGQSQKRGTGRPKPGSGRPPRAQGGGKPSKPGGARPGGYSKSSKPGYKRGNKK